MKNKYVLNAISIIISEFPDFAQIIEAPLAEKGIAVPSRPGTAADRPGTGSS